MGISERRSSLENRIAAIAVELYYLEKQYDRDCLELQEERIQLENELKEHGELYGS